MATVQLKNSNQQKPVGSVMVIGGGIAGIQAALDSAECGFKVYLVESESAVGGIMAQLDKTFPTNDCSSCMMGPRLVAIANHPDIEILADTHVLSVEGDPGRFQVTLRQTARAVDSQKCISCGLCTQKCPVEVADGFNRGLNRRKAIYITYPQAVPSGYVIDKAHCRYFTRGKCRICEKICPKKAIQFDQSDREFMLETGAVIMAGGIEPFDARLKVELGYGRWPNVITSLDYERILSAAGPFAGRIRRISDDRRPRRIAWIQCVGSRDESIGRGYCSSVCCMAAAKQAMITREHHPDIETTVFRMDMRAQGKGFDRFYERSRQSGGVRYVRAMISQVRAHYKKDTLEVVYTTDAPGQKRETFDLMVLSVGLVPHQASVALSRRLGLQTDAYGFITADPLNSTHTSRPGFWVCGAGQAPKDIQDTVCQSGSAVAGATAHLATARGQLLATEEVPPEKEVRGQTPRLGVFVCHCGINIAGVVDVAAVADYAASLPDVAYATHSMFACSFDDQQTIKQAIEEHRLNRIVVASCTPRTHETLFQNTLREAGLNPFLFELANIREQDAWVHRGDSTEATQKAKDLVRMSVARARLLKPLAETTQAVTPRALVIGGGLAGLSAAVSLAEHGFESAVVEKATAFGGQANALSITDLGGDPARKVRALLAEADAHPLIALHPQMQVERIDGSCGAFRATLAGNGSKQEIAVGVVIVATGGEAYTPAEYGYGQHNGVMTQRELELKLAADSSAAEAWRHVAMIQCVGSRDADHPYCSRVCCTAAVKNSLQLKRLNPDLNVTIFFRDLRTFGLKEDLYREARRKGVRFVRFRSDQNPEVALRDHDLYITARDELLGRHVRYKADRLILSAAIRPGIDNSHLAETLKLSLDQDGFFMEAHPKLRPLDLATPGFFLCGLAQGPKFAVEAVDQARGAVARALSILTKKRLASRGIVNRINTDLCRACGECQRACGFEAVALAKDILGRKIAAVDPLRCTGCGACNTVCPTGAATLDHFGDRHVNAMLMVAHRES